MHLEYYVEPCLQHLCMSDLPSFAWQRKSRSAYAEKTQDAAAMYAISAALLPVCCMSVWYVGLLSSPSAAVQMLAVTLLQSRGDADRPCLGQPTKQNNTAGVDAR